MDSLLTFQFFQRISNTIEEFTCNCPIPRHKGIPKQTQIDCLNADLAPLKPLNNLNLFTSFIILFIAIAIIKVQIQIKNLST